MRVLRSFWFQVEENESGYEMQKSDFCIFKYRQGGELFGISDFFDKLRNAEMRKSNLSTNWLLVGGWT